MSIHSIQASNCIFFKKPQSVEINEEALTRYATSQKIEVLIEELKENGPFIALGKTGPKFYKEAPFKLKNKVEGLDVYGWKSGSIRNENSGQSSVMILGAKKMEDQELIYYTLSDDITKNKTTAIRKYEPSTLDSRVYVTSHATFSDYLYDLYPPKLNQPAVYFITSQPTTLPILSQDELEYANILLSMDLESIIDMGEGEAACNAIGQKAFDQFKAEANGDSLVARQAIVNICDALIKMSSDGALRKQYVERAWDGVGDDKWRWFA